MFFWNFEDRPLSLSCGMFLPPDGALTSNWEKLYSRRMSLLSDPLPLPHPHPHPRCTLHNQLAPQEAGIHIHGSRPCLSDTTATSNWAAMSNWCRTPSGNAKSLASINYLPWRSATPACAVAKAPSQADCFIGERSVLRGKKEERLHTEDGNTEAATLYLKWGLFVKRCANSALSVNHEAMKLTGWFWVTQNSLIS